jgi:hypothetical protein
MTMLSSAVEGQLLSRDFWASHWTHFCESNFGLYASDRRPVDLPYINSRLGLCLRFHPLERKQLEFSNDLATVQAYPVLQKYLMQRLVSI